MPTFKEPAYTEDYRVRYPITVAPEMRTLRIPYAGPGAAMDPNIQGQLYAFVREYRDNGTGAISVSTPEGWEHVSLEVAGQISGMGVPPERILLGTDPTPQYGAEIEIGFISYLAQTHECGDFTEDLASTHLNEPSPNLGCATQNNIAAMVADPRDLVGPQPMDPSDTQRRLTVLERYRQGLPTPTERTEMQTGVVSQAAGN
jgi:pilus assembly protein CpaD